MGSCVDISRMMILASDIAKDWGINISQIPLCGCAPEWMSEKAVSIGNYVVATGIDTYLGVDPYSKGSSEITELLQGETRLQGLGRGELRRREGHRKAGRPDDRAPSRPSAQPSASKRLKLHSREVFPYESSYHRQGRRRQDDPVLHAGPALRRRRAHRPRRRRRPGRESRVWRWA